ncbi:MAG: quinone-interacting membrane-bound oxidoreductase complex subunit QmoC [Acidobacteriia bacterium]|nr:quinone-interacting membrane-bound oxidoreductase complex subunit QmoC [Terriglobia bacterium]
MSEAAVMQPDTQFIQRVMASGGGDLKKCYQCATCSVACELSPEESPFPRRQMIRAQWGLKPQLMSDPALWLCHNCGICTTRCPRGARPGDVLGALRREAIRQFAFPQFMGSLVASPKALPLLFALPTLIFLAIAHWAPKGQVTPHLEFANVFPIPILEALFFTVSGFVLLAFAVGLVRCIRTMRTGGATGKIMQGLLPALRQIMTHQRFWMCDARNWSLGHLLTLWGFAGLAVVGTVAGIGTMAGFLHTPLPLTNGLKLFANASAVVILCGGLILLATRMQDPVKRVGSTYFDWFFLAVLVGVVLTGIMAELTRLEQAAAVMYPVYFVHLVLIFSLFLYAPYSKFAHLAYRTVAMAAAGPWTPKPQVAERARESSAAGAVTTTH